MTAKVAGPLVTAILMIAGCTNHREMNTSRREINVAACSKYNQLGTPEFKTCMVHLEAQDAGLVIPNTPVIMFDPQ